jgi:hypothetical protein
LEPHRLHDLITGAGHRLQPEAEEALRLVRTPADAGVWLTHLRALGLEPAQATEIVAFLNKIGALRVSRSFGGKLAVAQQQAALLLRGAVPPMLARRLPLTTLGLAAGTTLALAPVLAAGTAVSVLAYGAGLAPRPVVTVAAVVAAALWTGVFAHELAHTKVLGRTGTGGAVLQQGMHVGIIHGPLSARAGVFCALAGPLAGAVVSVLVLLAGFAFTRLPVLPWLAALTAIFHLLSLLPASADGRNLRRHWLCLGHS